LHSQNHPINRLIDCFFYQKEEFIMKLNTVMMVTAIVAFVFGLAFIILPVQTLGLYGNTIEGTGVFMTRYFGSALIGLAFVAWLTRNAPSRGVVLGFFVTTVLGLVVALYDIFAGTGNALRWINVVIYLLLAAGFGYFGFIKTSQS